MDNNIGKIKLALKVAFPYTIPVLAGYFVLGFTFGILMSSAGFNFVYTFFMCVSIFGGSLQYLAVEILASKFVPIEVFVLTLIIHTRHIFYGIALLDKYKDIKGLKKFYIIFGLTDETFSLICSTDVPVSVDKSWFYFFITFLNHCYWIFASTLGSIFGNIVYFNTKGLDFVMTAMFVTILFEQILNNKKHLRELIGFIASVVCLILFGANSFLIPTMILIVIGLFIFKQFIEKAMV